MGETDRTTERVGPGGADVERGSDPLSKVERIKLVLDIRDAKRIAEVKRAEFVEAERRWHELLERHRSIYGR